MFTTASLAPIPHHVNPVRTHPTSLRLILMFNGYLRCLSTGFFPSGSARTVYAFLISSMYHLIILDFITARTLELVEGRNVKFPILPSRFSYSVTPKCGSNERFVLTQC